MEAKSRTTINIIVALLSSTLLVACNSPSSDDSTSGVKETVVMEGAKALPDTTLVDLATYGDKLALLHAVGEHRVEATPEELERGEGTITRVVTLAVDKDLWTSRGATRTVSPNTLPDTIDLANGGWMFHGNVEQRLLVEGDVDMRIGDDFLGVLTYSSLSTSPENPASWILVAKIPVTADGIVIGTGFDDTQSQLQSILKGLPMAEVSKLLAGTPVDALALKYLSQDPYSRYQHVLTDAANR